MGIYSRYSAAFLIFFLPLANATTVPVTVPSAHATVKNSSGVTVSGNSLRVTGPLQGTFIPNEGPGSRVSLKVKPVVDFSIPRTINAIKPLVRKGFAPALATAGVVWAINQLPGASFDPLTGEPVLGTPIVQTGKNWRLLLSGQSQYQPGFFSSPLDACKAYSPNPSATYTYRVSNQSTNSASCNLSIYGNEYLVGQLQALSFNCPHGFNSATGSCHSSSPAPVPFTEQNYAFVDSKLDAIVNPEWLRDILLTSCSGASNPENCADFLKDWQSNIVGPSTVPGGSTTTTSTYVKPDGTVGTKGSTTTNNYKITYGPTSFTFNKTSTTTYTEDGVETGTDVTEETPSPDEEPTPPEEEQNSFTDSEFADVPEFYEQKYPDGLEGVWDSAKSDIDNSQFMQFLHSFVPSFSGSCPSFALTFNIASWASYGSIPFNSLCYVFDFIKVILLVTAVFTARAITFGG